MTPGEADALASAPAVYVHVPFCARVCPYCDFAVVAGRDDLAERYVAAVVAEIAMADAWKPVDSVYFGGGTPSRLHPYQLGRILEAIDARHGIAQDAEVSLEANPEDIDPDRARALLAVGFNRISFGVQSLDGQVLLSLGRNHTPSAALDAVRAANQAGFGNVSVDLIFGTPGETEESWVRSVADVIATGVHHVSCYALTVEKGTQLHREVLAGATGPDPDTQAERWEAADALLTASGLARYEVSNWARPGSECRYNLTVWAQGEYQAYGLGAHGFRDGVRTRNLRHLDTYLETVEAGRRPVAGAEEIAGWDAELDRLFVGLRRAVGVARGSGTDRLMRDPQGVRLHEAGVITEAGDRLVVAKPLLTDAVHRAVLALRGWEQPVEADIV